MFQNYERIKTRSKMSPDFLLYRTILIHIRHYIMYIVLFCLFLITLVTLEEIRLD